MKKYSQIGIEIGFDGGAHGGEIVFAGPPLALIQNRHSTTAEFLRKFIAK